MLFIAKTCTNFANPIHAKNVGITVKRITDLFAYANRPMVEGMLKAGVTIWTGVALEMTNDVVSLGKVWVEQANNTTDVVGFRRITVADSIPAGFMLPDCLPPPMMLQTSRGNVGQVCFSESNAQIYISRIAACQPRGRSENPVSNRREAPIGRQK